MRPASPTASAAALLRPLLLLVSMAAVPLPARAQTAPPAPPVVVSNAWARATAGGQQAGAAYLTLLSPVPDRLLGVSTPVAGVAEVHEMAMDGSVMRMRQVEGLDLPAGRTLTLAPGGFHLMLMRLQGPLVAGQTFPVRLSFAHAAPVEVTVTVAPIGATGPGTGR